MWHCYCITSLHTQKIVNLLTKQSLYSNSEIQYKTMFWAIFIITQIIRVQQILNAWYIGSKQLKNMLFQLLNNTGCRVCRCVFRRVCRRGSWHYLILMSAAASADASSDAAANYFLKNIRKHSKCWEKG